MVRRAVPWDHHHGSVSFRFPRCVFTGLRPKFLASVDPNAAYVATDWQTVSGGLGIFTSPGVTTIPVIPLLVNYVSNILQDPTVSARVDAISPQCLAQSSCQSFLLTSGLAGISPFPFQDLDPSLTAYAVQDAPSYQIDAWTRSVNNTYWADEECHVYAAANDLIQICVKSEDEDGLVAGE